MWKKYGQIFTLCSWLFSAEVFAFPKKIASGTVGTDEVLLEILKGEEERIVALSKLADDPRYSFITQIPKSVKARVGDNVENVLLLKPDIVFLASYTGALISEQLKAAGIKVHVQKSFDSFDDVKANIQEVGNLVGKPKEALALVKGMEAKIARAKKEQKTCKKGKKPSFLQYVANDFLPGEGTIIDDVGHIAGYRNLLRDISWKGWAQISQEILIQQNPDVIIASENDAPTKEKMLEILRKSPTWKRMSAVREGRIILVPDRLLYTVSHHTADLVTFLITERPCPV